MRVKASILGHLGEGKNLLNGQTIKTKIVAEELQNQLGQDQVLKIDTYGGWINLFKAPFQTFCALKNSANVLIFPAHNGLRVYAPLLYLQRYIFSNTKLHYIVIGGWLPDFLLERKCLSRILKSFDGIYVETSTMKAALEAQGFSNIYIMPNGKNLSVLSADELVYDHQEPYKLCTFSRVMKEKGIEDAVQAVMAVNAHFGRTVYTLDIFGQIDPGQKQWFAELQKTFPDEICYRGVVPFDKSVEVLKDYFAMLFPTRFYTEGIPGTIIDAYAAGIPVIAAKWESFADMIEDGVTGIGYHFGDNNALTSVLMDISSAPEDILAMKLNCLRKAKAYCPETAIDVLVQNMEKGMK